jgi:pyruvate kinase
MNLKQIENFARTKILCTIGPATNSADSIKKLMYAGADAVRLNFSHGSYDFFENVFNNIKSVDEQGESPLSVLIDLQGPKMRIGELEDPEIEIITGNKITITPKNIIGTKDIFSVSYTPIIDDAQKGDLILIDDGLIRVRVIERVNDTLSCIIESGGILRPRKGINLPGMKLSTPSVTEKDLNNIEFALKHHVDYIALSFVRTEKDILTLREWLKNKNMLRPIIAKIEKKEAVDNFDEILKAADGIMVARGDLGVELPAQNVPVIQKSIIKKCNAEGKPVITATQMLESMIFNPIPTRAEASDVANAVWDGTDVVMLSGETSIGRHPFKTVQMMNDIIRKAEENFIPKEIVFTKSGNIEDMLFDSVGKAIVNMSNEVNASAIVVFTLKGRTAINLSKYRPNAKIIAVSNDKDTINSLTLRWGITSMYLDEIHKETIAIDKAKKIIMESGHIKSGDIVVFSAGAPYPDKSRINWQRFEII